MSAASRPRDSTPGEPDIAEAAIWQRVELGGYRADLPIWEELADPSARVLELGCGCGRVALHLAGRGCEVWGVDFDPVLLEELRRAGDARALSLTTVEADVTELDLGERFDLVLAPLQLVNLLDGEGRVALLHASSRHLRSGGVLAVAVVFPGNVVSHAAVGSATGVGARSAPPASEGRGDPGGGAHPGDPYGAIPDLREIDGTIYSSLPLGAILDGEALEVRRLRQVVSPAGDLEERVHVEKLHLVAPELLEADARAAGLAPLERCSVPSAGDEAESTVVSLRLAAAAGADASKRAIR